MQHENHAPNETMEHCIEECLRCHTICTITVNHCLGMGGDHASPSHITRLLDCAEMCQTSANFMMRGSSLHAHTCRVCAEACIQCANDCEQMAAGDQQMLACAEQCRRCAESCQRMTTME